MRWPSPRRIGAVVGVETAQLIHDRPSLSLLLLLPIVQILLYGYAIDLTPRHIPIAVSASDARLVGPMTRAIDENPALTRIGAAGPPGSAERAVREGRALVGIELGHSERRQYFGIAGSLTTPEGMVGSWIKDRTLIHQGRAPVPVEDDGDEFQCADRLTDPAGDIVRQVLALARGISLIVEQDGWESAILRRFLRTNRLQVVLGAQVCRRSPFQLIGIEFQPWFQIEDLT